MSRSVRISIFAIALLALCAAPQLRADGIDTFTYTESGDGVVVTLVWQLPASPSLDSSSFTNTGFTIETDTGSFFLDGAFLFPFSDTFSFSDQPDGGGVNDIGYAGLGSVLALSTYQFDQFYSGGADSPTFTPGTYQVTNAVDTTPGTLVISAPEPSAIILLLVGLCGMVFVAFRKKLVVV
jgi:hypothetical protein